MLTFHLLYWQSHRAASSEYSLTLYRHFPSLIIILAVAKSFSLIIITTINPPPTIYSMFLFFWSKFASRFGASEHFPSKLLLVLSSLVYYKGRMEKIKLKNAATEWIKKRKVGMSGVSSSMSCLYYSGIIQDMSVKVFCSSCVCSSNSNRTSTLCVLSYLLLL